MTTIVTLREVLDQSAVQARFRYRQMTLRTSVRALMTMYDAVWAAQARAVELQLEHHRAEFSEAFGDDEGPDDLGSLLEQVSDKMRPALAAALHGSLLGGRDMASLDLPASFSVPDIGATEWATQHAGELIAKVDSTTRDRLRGLLVNAREQGWSFTKTADAIKAEFDGFSVPAGGRGLRDRAQLIASTEAGNAYEAGGRLSITKLTELGLVYEKSWLADASACVSICLANAGEDWIAFEDAHESGDMSPLGHPGCGCTEMYRRVSAGGEEVEVDDLEVPE